MDCNNQMFQQGTEHHTFRLHQHLCDFSHSTSRSLSVLGHFLWSSEDSLHLRMAGREGIQQPSEWTGQVDMDTLKPEPRQAESSDSTDVSTSSVPFFTAENC